MQQTKYLKQESTLTSSENITEAKRPSPVKRVLRTHKFFKEIILALQDKKAENIVSIDLKNIEEAVTDFFIVCTATSSTHVKALADFVEVELKDKCDERPYKVEGYAERSWILVDYVDVVIHIMLQEQRDFYKIEALWADAQLSKH